MNDELLGRYSESLLTVFGIPPLVLERGEGCYVWDVDGRRYLDLVGGIAVNALGHAHPVLVRAVADQAALMLHTSNLFTTPGQVQAAEQLLDVAGVPDGSRVFFCSSGSEAVEAAVKLSRRTGRGEIIAAEGGFHGRTVGAVSLTHKPAYREPFEPLLPDVRHVPYGDVDALESAVTERTAAVVLEPIQGEAGAVVPPEGYLREARRITQERGALLVVDEIQTGVGRTGDWFAFQYEQVVPDAFVVAKALGGGVPIGALVTVGPEVSGLLTQGQHGSTFGGNPLAAAAALAVLRTMREDGLLQASADRGQQLADGIEALNHPLVHQVRGRGLLRGVVLREPVAQDVVRLGRERGLLLNAVSPTVLRFAPPLVITAAQVDHAVATLDTLLKEAS